MAKKQPEPIDVSGVEVVEVGDRAYEVPIPAAATEGQKLAVKAAGLSIVDEESLELAVDWARRLDDAHKRSEAARTFLVKPLKDHATAIDQVFKPHNDEIKAALAALKGKIRDYHAERERVEQEAARAAAEFVGASQEVQEIVGSVARRDVGSASVAERWDYEVQDLRELCRQIADGRAPVEFVEPVRGALRAWLNAMVKEAPPQDGMVVHGIRIYKERDVRL